MRFLLIALVGVSALQFAAAAKGELMHLLSDCGWRIGDCCAVSCPACSCALRRGMVQ